ncbi:restriction endonuclease subunit S [Acetobacter vaccinii]|uniref:Restriction endonuclease subunit S n=1 Tax=Acetobacter vaccinii TaxID=2592655 RepID=A0A5C1YT87_9PROT|nr:restriction endonuclease subunit S [Acetobacter vaccinii]QEO18227.1 restriction endonuclease subunit S [Acetobacter vaccinii]
MSVLQVCLGDLIEPAKTRKAGSTNYPLLSMTMAGGLVDPTTKFKKRVASEDTSGYKVVERGQLVVGFPIDEGVLSFQQLHDEAIVSPAYGIWEIRSGASVDPMYLENFLKSPQAIAYYLGKLRSTTARRRSLDRGSFLALPVPLPPLEEQKRIAGILNQAAELYRLRTRALDKLNTLGQAIFHEIFGSGSFERVALAEVIEARSSLADPILPENAQLPHVGPEHIRQGGAEIEWDRVVSCAQDGVTSGKYRFEPNDIIYSKIRPYLNKVAIADRVGMCSADMYALVANSDVVKNSYLHFILGSSDFLSYAASVSGRANIPKINRKQLMAYEIPVAPLEMQAEFEGKISSIRGQAAKLSKSLSTGKKLFASLQHRAFRGEL